jgi:LuxR family maltose regulon positive regulatory protein
LRDRHGNTVFIDRILAAFPEVQIPESTAIQAPFGEPLTERELEILGLLAERLTSKEIGAQLFISPGTVRQHCHRIYRKLEVNGRRQAVDKARLLGILPGN